MTFLRSIRPGDAAPDFDVLDERGGRHSLADHRGRWLTLFFYPRDLSPVCVREACAFNDLYDDFLGLGCDVLGCSGQDAESHLRMSRACRLRYRLLCDREGTMRRAWAVRSFPFPRRETYLVDPAGVVRFVFRGLLWAQEHADRALAFLSAARA